MLRPTGAALVLCLVAAVAGAQVPDAEPDARVPAEVAEADTALADAGRGDTVILPVLGYTPDTGLLFGGLALRFFYLDPPGDGVRSSVLSPVVLYTLKNQLMIFLGLDLNWDDGRWHAAITPSYQKFPDDFYGLGRDAPADPLENYTPEQFAVEAMVEREVLGALRLGVGYRAARHQMLEVEEGGVLDGGTVAGTGTVVLSAPGLLAAWDTRDHTWWPRRGLWTRAGVSLHRPGWGSDFTFTEHTVDARAYVPVGGGGVLAAQAAYAALDGRAPFFHLPRLGGQDGLRGYSGGRFRDDARLLVRTEWRSGPLWRKLGAVVFAGIGDVAPRPQALGTTAGLTTIGCGLRWRISDEEKVNLRMDMGFGKDDGGFYLSLGEAF